MDKTLVTVEVDGLKTCLLIDPSCFDDPGLEAATRIVEKNRWKLGFAVNATTRCWMGTHVRNYNTYWILVNAACYESAERLRAFVRKTANCDLAHQPYHGGDLTLDTYA